MTTGILRRGNGNGSGPLAHGELFVRYRRGDEKACGEILEAYLPMVVKLARRFTFPGSPVHIEDLIEEGNLGLLAAIERFDPRLGCQFSTYAFWWIQHYIYRALLNEAHLIRLPKKELLAMRKAFATSQHLFQELERAPTLSEVAYRLEKTMQETEDLLKKSSRFSHLSSLDEPQGEDEESYTRGDQVAMVEANLDDVVENELLTESLRVAVDQLSEAERAVMSLRFGLEGGSRYTYEEIETNLGIPRSRIRTLERTALQKLRSLAREIH